MRILFPNLVAFVAVCFAASAFADEPPKAQKSCILIWLEGGAPTGEMWDPKPESPRSVFKAIETAGDMKICEHLPLTAKVMDKVSVVRSLSTRESAHFTERPRYYMLTGYVPNPNMTHPTMGAIVSRELGTKRVDLELPAFISINGRYEDPGYLGAEHAPLVIDCNGRLLERIADNVDNNDVEEKRDLLKLIDSGFSDQRGDELDERNALRERVLKLAQIEDAPAVTGDDGPMVLEPFGDNEFGRGLLLARRLVEEGVPFVEVTFPRSWDVREKYVPTVRDELLPMLDRGVSGLIADLEARDLLDKVVVVVLGPHGRVQAPGGRWRSWARSWSMLIGGGGLKGGQVVGATDKDGLSVTTAPYSADDVMATILSALDIRLDTTYINKRGRPMSIANGGKVISDLWAK